MRTLFKQICMIIILTVPLCNSHTSSALSTTERCAIGAACVGITYGIGRIGAWVRIWETERHFSQEIDQFTNFYGSQEEAKLILQDIILIRHSYECANMHYRVYPLLWYKEMIDAYISRLLFWRFTTLGSSDWKTIHTRIDQLHYLRNLVVANYLYISELRAFNDNQQRYSTV